MAVSKNIHQSYGNRVVDSFRGALIGPVIFVLGGVCLFWNEGRAVREHRKNEFGAKAVVEVTDVRVPDVEQEGKLVHMVGKANTEEMMRDEEFGVEVNAIRLSRVVEMYQWMEREERKTKENVGGSKDTTVTYRYYKGWNAGVVDSQSFAEEGHDNPVGMEVEGRSWSAESVTVGGFHFPSERIGSIGGERDYVLGSDYVLPEGMTNRMAVKSDKIYYSAKGEPEKVHTTPEVGDLRIGFRWVPCHEVSLVAKQVGDSVAPYPTKEGGSIFMMRDGTASAEEMFAAAEKANRMVAWLLRLVGFVLLNAGVKKLLGPLQTLASVLPFLGKIVGVGTGVVASVISVPVGLVVVAVAWLTYRPVLGIGLLLAAVAAAVLLRRKAPAVGEKKAA